MTVHYRRQGRVRDAWLACTWLLLSSGCSIATRDEYVFVESDGDNDSDSQHPTEKPGANERVAGRDAAAKPVSDADADDAGRDSVEDRDSGSREAGFQDAGEDEAALDAAPEDPADEPGTEAGTPADGRETLVSALRDEWDYQTDLECACPGAPDICLDYHETMFDCMEEPLRALGDEEALNCLLEGAFVESACMESSAACTGSCNQHSALSLLACGLVVENDEAWNHCTLLDIADL